MKSILVKYADLLPLTLRQIFYLLGSHHGFEKNERAYKNELIETVGMARRGRLIPMDAIRDDGFTQTRRKGWDSADHLLGTIRAEVKRFTLDRQQGQEQRLMLWCEAAGMVPIERLERWPCGPSATAWGPVPRCRVSRPARVRLY